MILSQTSLWISLLKRLLIYIFLDFSTLTFWLGLKCGSPESPNSLLETFVELPTKPGKSGNNGSCVHNY